MNLQDKESIQAIQGTAGFRVIQYTIEQKIKSLESVRNIKRDGLVAEQALARQLAVEVLEEFLSDLNILTKPQGTTNKTYE